MKDLQAIARYMRLPEEQLKFPIELLHQGYEPNYLANYRPDELGNIDEQTLSILRRALNYSDALKAHKEKVQQTLEREQQWNETVAAVVAQACTISQVDTVTRHLRARRNSRSISEKCPQVETVGQAILTMQGEAPKDILAWVAEIASVPQEQAAEVLEQTKRWMIYLLSEDVRLMQDLQRTLLKKAGISVKVLPDPPKGSEAEASLDAQESSAQVASEPVAHVASAPENVAETTTASTNTEATPSAEPIAPPTVPAETGNTESSEPSNQNAVSEVALSSGTTDAVAPLIAEFHQGRKQGKAIKTKTLSDKQLSPRQRRRKWLRSILETYAKLKKPLTALTPYQILMLSRGQRSQIVSVQLHYDEKPLIQACRESLCPGRHPMHHLLLEIAEEGFRNQILPRLHQDIFTILEEDAHTDLTEAAVVHLQASLLQRPVRGHCILIIDAIGPKMAAVAVVDADGKVVFTNEIPCNSNRADVVAQNVVTLGQWIHEHRVTLLAISNGPARRYLMHTVSELLKQSAEGSLCWTMVDRAGADAYCMSRGCLVELPHISRRHRAAVWLAWRLQDPLKQILKVDPVRLRLGSYQRELPPKELEAALQHAVSAAITQAGIDVFHADVDVLKRIPGMTTEAAKGVVNACHEDRISNRETLMAVLREHLSEMHARQAIGFLKVYGSSNVLDGTTIHPDDYRLAERLIAHASIAPPSASPANWTKPDYAQLAAATAAADVEHAKQVNEAPFGDLGEEHHEEHEEHPTEEESSLPSADESAEVAAESSESETVASAPEASSDATSEQAASNESSDPPVNSEEPTSEAPVATETSEPVKSSVAMPEIPSGPMPRPTLSIDVERLARSWQVGREKMKRVANCLQFAFTDSRDFQYPVPLLTKVPRLDLLQPGMMLQALVIGVADFGVFVDLGPECSGLIHISRLAPDFIEDPHQFVQVGDLVPVWVLNVDDKKKRVSLTAIPPGTPTRREAQAAAHGGNERGHQGGREQRAPRGDRNQRPEGGQSGNRESRATGNAPRAGAGTAGQQGQRNERRGGGEGRSENRGSGNRNDNRGNRGGRPGGRDNRDRSRGHSNEEAPTPRKPTRVEPPKPITPISDAMQAGKEPLRSFSDLLQFMKHQREEPVVEPAVTPKPTDTLSVAPSSDAPTPASESASADTSGSSETSA